MSVKKSVRLGPLAERLCLILSDSGEPNFSGTINKVMDRYNHLIAASMPELEEPERLAIVQCYNGYMKPERTLDQIAGLEFTISEGYKYDDNVKELIRSEQAFQALLEKVRSWSTGERIAVIDMTERYWGEQRQ